MLAALAEKERARQLKLRLKLRESMRETKRLREEFNREFQNRLFTVLTTALGVVAALFWQAAIIDTIKAFIPVSGVWEYEILSAFIVTLLVVFVIFLLHKVQPKKK